MTNLEFACIFAFALMIVISTLVLYWWFFTEPYDITDIQFITPDLETLPRRKLPDGRHYVTDPVSGTDHVIREQDDLYEDLAGNAWRV